MILNQVAQGGSPAISVVDTTDSGGGTVRTITASGTTIPTPASDISKLILNGVTQMDVTDTTATVSDVASGKVFTQVDGTTGTGTADVLPPEPEPLDVDFVDYDGTLLYTYTAADFANLSALPANPTHNGLIAQGWNWTLADAKAAVAEYGALVIGQNYTTSDGKTRVYIDVTDFELPYDFALNFQASAKGGVTVNWGDGTINVSTANANANSEMKHKYSSSGSYIITLEVTSGTVNIGYNGANRGFLFNGTTDSLITRSCVKAVEIGNNVIKFDRQTFKSCTNIKTISIPTTVATLSDNVTGEVFHACRNLKCLVIPNNVTYTTTLSMIAYCNRLKYISFSKTAVPFSNNLFATDLDDLRKFTVINATSLPTATLLGAYNITHLVIGGTWTAAPPYCLRDSLQKIKNALIIPDTVTSISQFAFDNTFIKEIHMKPISPPTAGNSAIIKKFDGLVIYVPQGSLSAYQTATNWSSFADYMQEEPQ